MDWWTGFRGPENWYLGPLNQGDQSRWESSNNSFLVLAGIAWDILVTSIEQDASVMEQDDICTVRYEDFLEDPVGEIRRLCEFSELDFPEDFANRIRASRINTGRKQAFLTDLSSAQVSELTSCIADSLAKYGYSDNG
jgi:hypothetical protein